ncbi:replication factor A protein 3 [Radiomyces spectabilis]|uniref:replication factor A protein 3 n=1 Tax=Radiomyces spectabilis TaxID=64574 RepID=UPI00221EA159|nr:replication factor A protein 3 [Radiomyces spectabilis]KAI8388674.1 replication factor A protein 3 [Radiomyces spectabilis]
MDKPTPRINSQLRENYVGQTVRVVGKVLSFSGDTAVLEATDGGQILVKVNGQSQWGSDYMEVIGRVESDFSLMEFKSANMGNSLDMKLADKVVQYGQKCPELFDLKA